MSRELTFGQGSFVKDKYKTFSKFNTEGEQATVVLPSANDDKRGIEITLNRSCALGSLGNEIALVVEHVEADTVSVRYDEEAKQLIVQCSTTHTLQTILNAISSDNHSNGKLGSSDKRLKSAAGVYCFSGGSDGYTRVGTVRTNEDVYIQLAKSVVPENDDKAIYVQSFVSSSFEVPAGSQVYVKGIDRGGDIQFELSRG